MVLENRILRIQIGLSRNNFDKKIKSEIISDFTYVKYF
jgi:hypothetical protein